ncbi:MAG: NAD(P)-dependent oxidoreductase [Arenicella sp.]
MASHQPKIGFIGIGLMGHPMSQRLLKAGMQLTVWNRTIEKCDELKAQGATVANSIGELVANNDIIMCCLTDTDAVEKVVLSNEFLQNSHANKVLIDFSSIDPAQTKIFAKKLHQASGMRWIDSPVSGGVAGAESGKLVVMSGGNTEDVDAIRPILAHLSQRVTHMGPVGSGQATKVCNQMIVSCNILVMAEVLALAKKSGIHSEKIPSALAGGFADSIPFQLTGQRMVDADFDDIKWHTKTLAKDLDLASGMAESHNSNTPIASLAQQLMRQYCNIGYADIDPANLINVYLEE